MLNVELEVYVMMKKWLVTLSIVAIVTVLSISSLHAEVPNGERALEREWLCPIGDKETILEMDRISADRDAIEKVMTDWATAVVAGDVDSLGLLVTEDAEFWTHGAVPLVGRQALVAAFKPFLTQYKLYQQYDCKELIIGGNWAFMRGMEINHLTPRNGEESVVRRQRAFSVLRREANGKWLFARGMTNMPPDE